MYRCVKCGEGFSYMDEVCKVEVDNQNNIDVKDSFSDDFNGYICVSCLCELEQ